MAKKKASRKSAKSRKSTKARKSPRARKSTKARKSTTKAVKKGKARRTTMRSSTGKKLYAVRDAEGKFKDIQTYARAHAQDIRRKAADES